MHDMLKMGRCWVKTQLHYLRYINALMGTNPQYYCNGSGIAMLWKPKVMSNIVMILPVSCYSTVAQSGTGCTACFMQPLAHTRLAHSCQLLYFGTSTILDMKVGSGSCPWTIWHNLPISRSCANFYRGQSAALVGYGKAYYVNGVALCTVNSNGWSCTMPMASPAMKHISSFAKD